MEREHNKRVGCEKERSEGEGSEGEMRDEGDKGIKGYSLWLGLDFRGQMLYFRARNEATCYVNGAQCRCSLGNDLVLRHRVTGRRCCCCCCCC